MYRSQDRSLLSRTLQYMFKYWKIIILTFILTIIVSGLSIARPWIQKLLIDNITLGGETRKLAKIVGLLVGIAVLQVLCRVAQRYFFVNIQESSARDLRLDISNWLFSLKMRFTEGRDTGSIISTILQDVEKMSELYGPVVVSLCADLLKFIAVLGIMVYLSMKLTLIVIPLFILMMFLLKDATRPIQKASNLMQEAKSIVSSSVKEFWVSLAETKSLNGKHYVMASLSDAYENLRSRGIRLETIQALFHSVDIFVWLIAAAMLWVGGKDVIEGEMTMGDLIAYWGYMALILGPINNFVNSLGIGRASLGAAERVFDLLDTGEVEASRVYGCVEFPEDYSRIEMKSVDFQYSREEKVLESFSCMIERGEKVAIVGRSGCGKSTIASLIVRLFSYDRGSIMIDDIPINDICLHSLRANVGLVFQKPHIYSGTILENISLAAPDAGEDAVKGAAERSGLGEFIESLEDGYSTLVGDGGRELSGGQAQRIALARMFLKHPAVVILDESTSALDLTLEKRIIENVMDEFRDATVIVISHRESTVAAVDRKIVLSDA